MCVFKSQIKTQNLQVLGVKEFYKIIMVDCQIFTKLEMLDLYNKLKFAKSIPMENAQLTEKMRKYAQLNTKSNELKNIGGMKPNYIPRQDDQKDAISSIEKQNKNNQIQDEQDLVFKKIQEKLGHDKKSLQNFLRFLIISNESTKILRINLQNKTISNQDGNQLDWGEIDLFLFDQRSLFESQQPQRENSKFHKFLNNYLNLRNFGDHQFLFQDIKFSFELIVIMNQAIIQFLVNNFDKYKVTHEFFNNLLIMTLFQHELQEFQNNCTQEKLNNILKNFICIQTMVENFCHKKFKLLFKIFEKQILRKIIFYSSIDQIDTTDTSNDSSEEYSLEYMIRQQVIMNPFAQMQFGTQKMICKIQEKFEFNISQCF